MQFPVRCCRFYTFTLLLLHLLSTAFTDVFILWPPFWIASDRGKSTVEYMSGLKRSKSIGVTPVL